jgi:hypothetical protein
MTDHRVTISEHQVAHLGRRWKVTCSCGRFTTPLLTREAADMAKDRHKWSVGDLEGFRR